MRAWYHTVAPFTTHALTRIAYEKIKNVMNMKKQGVVASYFWLCHLIWHWNMKKLAALNCLERTPVANISFILCTKATAGLTKTTGVWKADFPQVKPGQAQDRCESCQKKKKQLWISGRWEGRSRGMKVPQGGRKTWQGRTSLQGWEQWPALTSLLPQGASAQIQVSSQ